MEDGEELHLTADQEHIAMVFCEVTEADLEVAKHILDSSDWQLKTAIAFYYDQNREIVIGGEEHAAVICLDKPGAAHTDSILTDDSDDDIRYIDSGAVGSAHRGQCSETQSVSAVHVTPESRNASGQLTLLSWNVDGLDEVDLAERTKAVADIINQLCPDVVLLQEVVDVSCVLYQRYLPQYKLVSAKVEDFQQYFTCILLRNCSVKYSYHYIEDLPTIMLRNLLVAEVMFGDVKVHLLTAHLESMKGHSETRKSQLKQIFNTMKSLPQDSTVIYGGDTNLRDAEVVAVGGLPDGVRDVWMELGSDSATQYTWDLYRNNNLAVKFKSRCRFDRLFVRGSGSGFNSLTPHSLVLTGTNKLGCGRHPSDHWGLLTVFKLSPYS